jgi:hypothetical protein
MVGFLMRPMKRKFMSNRSSSLSLKMITFCKSVYCPASQDLLAFQRGITSTIENEDIQKHLESCEFCAAEVEFYEHSTQSEEIVATVDIPLPLFQLAEALLGNGQKKFNLLNKLLNENEGLSLNKV